MRIIKKEQKTQTDSITMRLPYAMACYRLDVLELKASIAWSKEIIWVIYAWWYYG